MVAHGCDLTARWEHGSLTFEWTPGHDGVGGTETVEPDDDGLYAIGGLWPWDYEGPLPVPEARRQAALVRPSAADVASAAGRPSTPPAAAAPATPVRGR
ncbi:hypothetical protein ACFXAF_19370 [Kitasatospora sp. NPDC059463]|uniref:hypothetical protein n=1 Tax=unclassified Kitasatospora TaxID=2633591 RepID=UPI0036BFC64F